VGERSLNPRPYKAKHNSNARVEHRRAKKKRASQRSAKERRKEGKKERKKGRTRSTSRSRAEYINFYEERLGFYVRREAGLKSMYFGQSGRSKIINFVFLPFFKRP